MKIRPSRLLVLAFAAVLAACSTLDRSPAPTVRTSVQWVVLPFANNTETPLAANRAEAIAEGLLRANGVAKLRRYPATLAQDALFENNDRKAFDTALASLLAARANRLL